MDSTALPPLPPHLQPLHSTLRRIAPELTLVGGAVRDLILGVELHDLDYVVPQRAMSSARKLADQLGAAYYALDAERDVGRVVWSPAGDDTLIIDVAAWQGPTLDADLRGRDFTINAMAMLPDGSLYDPLHGQQDLQRRLLRPCSAHSLLNDPLRILRALRFVLSLHCQPVPELPAMVEAAVPSLTQVSPERRRDEWLRILAQPAPERVFAWLDAWHLLDHILPPMSDLRGLSQPAIHAYDAYDHSIAALQNMALLDRWLRGEALPSREAWQPVSDLLAPHRQQLATYLNASLAADRPRWLWLRFAALAHDWGKSKTCSQAADGGIRFYGHEKYSAAMADAWMQAYHAANAERAFVQTVCLLHMRPLSLLQAGTIPGRRAIFRLHRDAGDTALALILLHIADHLAMRGPRLVKHEWAAYLQRMWLLVAPLLNDSPQAVVPRPLINGRDLIQRFDLSPGPLIGRLLASLQEAQAVGEVKSEAEAIAWVEKELANRDL